MVDSSSADMPRKEDIMKTGKFTMRMRPDVEEVLSKLAKLHNRSMSNLIEVLILKEAAEQGVQSDGAFWCPKCGDFLGEGRFCSIHGLPASPRS